MDLIFRAIADPVRREMLVRLTEREQSASALGAGFYMSQPAASQHLKLLREAGLVTQRRSGRQQLYQLNPEGLRTVRDWLSRFERFWEQRISALEGVLDALPDNDGEIDV